MNRLLPLAFALALTVNTMAHSQEEDAEPGPLFFEAMNVNVVNVEVFVTDRNGQPITDLMADDFELFEDGRPVTLTNFYAVDGRTAETPTQAQRAEILRDAPAGVTASHVTAATPEDQRLSLILYFDNVYLKPFSRERAVRETRRFLTERLTPEDQVMVVTFDRTLHVRQTFTRDLNLIYDALDQIEELTGFAVQAEAERKRVVKLLDTAKTFQEAEPFVDFYAKEIFSNLNRSIDGLKELVGPLAGLPGRKALLHVSDGVPMEAGADLFQLLNLRFGDSSSGSLLGKRYSARNRFRELISSANSNRVTFYTLEAAGLRSHTSLSAEFRSSAAGGSMIEVDVTRDFNYQETLQMMAADTGGLASINTNNLSGALERMAADLRTYYSLGYSPEHVGDGRRHKIEVKVKRKGARVRHRSDYRDKTFEARLTDGVLAALRFGGGTNSLDLRLDFASLQPQGDGYFLLPIQVSVPFGRVTLVPQGERHRGQLQVVMAVIDDEGATSPPEVTPLPLEIPNAHVEELRRSQDVVYTAALRMRKGLHQVAVGIRDDLSGETAVVRQTVRVGENR
jgi:VWFA-related protein